LRSYRGLAGRAVEFVAYTGRRQGEARKLRWSDVDLRTGVVNTRAETTKSGDPDKYALPAPALELLRQVPAEARGYYGDEYSDAPEALVFATADGTEFSDAALGAVLKTLDERDRKRGGPGYRDPRQPERICSPHGLRVALKSWAQGETDIPDEVSEACLSHAVGGQVRAAYARRELLPARHVLLERWCDFLLTPYVDNVTQLDAIPCSA
jgi:integrase